MRQRVTAASHQVTVIHGTTRTRPTPAGTSIQVPVVTRALLLVPQRTSPRLPDEVPSGSPSGQPSDQIPLICRPSAMTPATS